MKWHMRKRLRLGPFYVNLTEHGPSSFGIRIGPFSHNFTRGSSHLDTPGPGSIRWDRRDR